MRGKPGYTTWCRDLNMDESGGTTGDRLIGGALDEAGRLLRAFSGASVLGLSVCDDQLRYQGINDALAAMNGISAAAHVGNTVRDILGNAAAQPEPALRRVLASGQPVYFELTAMLPTRSELGYWIESYFPILGQHRRVSQVASITIEVTTQKKLEKAFRRLTGEVHWTGSRRTEWLARDLHDSINEYHQAITACLAHLTESLARLHVYGWEPDWSLETMAECVASLDRRIANMRTTVANVAGYFCDSSNVVPNSV